MFKYKTLAETGITAIHDAFVNAFSDYQVKMDLPLWKFQNMLKRRGFVPDISLGAFKDDVFVGFVLNGLRSWNNKPTVYDLGTGVIPEYRKQGITSSMLSNVKELLVERKIEQYLLEVIQTNTSALNLYKKQGFEIVRDFACFRLDKGSLAPASDSLTCSPDTYKPEHVGTLEAETWEELKTFWDFNPSWQNSIDSITAAQDSFFFSIIKQDKDICGYGIIDKRSGDLVQLAVNKAYRHKGIGKSILTDLFSQTEATNISALNIDTSAAGVINFLMAAGFISSVNQYEMLLKI